MGNKATTPATMTDKNINEYKTMEIELHREDFAIYREMLSSSTIITVTNKNRKAGTGIRSNLLVKTKILEVGSNYSVRQFKLTNSGRRYVLKNVLNVYV